MNTKAVIQKQEELNKLRKSYIEFLAEQLGSNAMFLKIHHVVTSEKDIKIGAEYRKQIDALESELSLLQEKKEERVTDQMIEDQFPTNIDAIFEQLKINPNKVSDGALEAIKSVQTWNECRQQGAKWLRDKYEGKR
jgi:hypothetical protein